MIKRIVLFLVIVVLLFLGGVSLHQYLNSNTEEISRFSVVAIYGFHAVASSIIYILIEACFKFIPNQAGYSFLALMTVKLGFFILLFSGSLYNGIPLERIEKIVLIIPLFIFLITETLAIVFLLNNSTIDNDI